MEDEKEQLEDRGRQYLAGLDHGYILAAEKPDAIGALTGVFDTKTFYGQGFLQGVKIGTRRREIYLKNFDKSRGRGR